MCVREREKANVGVSQGSVRLVVLDKEDRWPVEFYLEVFEEK